MKKLKQARCPKCSQDVGVMFGRLVTHRRPAMDLSTLRIVETKCKGSNLPAPVEVPTA